MPDLPTLALTVLSSAFGAGVAWASLRNRLRVLEIALAQALREPDGAVVRRLDRLEGRVDGHEKSLHEAQLEATRTAARISDFKELKANVITRDVFDERMSSQDVLFTSGINELRSALARKVSVSTLSATPSPAPEPALPMPPRPRMPSRPR